jgi:hypothetical protein
LTASTLKTAFIVALQILIIAILLMSITSTAALSVTPPSAPSGVSPVVVGTMEIRMTNSSEVYNLIATLSPPTLNTTNSGGITYIMFDEAQAEVLVNNILDSLRQYNVYLPVDANSAVLTTTPSSFTDAQRVAFANQLVSLSLSYTNLAELAVLHVGVHVLELTAVHAFFAQSIHIPPNSLVSQVINSLVAYVTSTGELCFVAYNNRGILNPTVINSGPILAKISNCPKSTASPVYLVANSQYVTSYNPRYIAGSGQKITVIITGLRSTSGLPSSINLSFHGTYSSYQGVIKIEGCNSAAGSSNGICTRSGSLPLNVSMEQECSLMSASCSPNYAAEVPILSGPKVRYIN